MKFCLPHPVCLARPDKVILHLLICILAVSLLIVEYHALLKNQFIDYLIYYWILEDGYHQSMAII